MQANESSPASRHWLRHTFPDQGQWPRTRRLLVLSGVVCMLHGIAWSSYYLSHGMDVLALLLGLLVLVGAACLWLSRSVETTSVLGLSHAVTVLTVVASLADTPDVGAQRSAHLFLLPVATAAFLVFRSEGFYLRWVHPGMCLALLVVLELTDVGFGQKLQLLPEQVHRLGQVLNTVSAIVLTGGVLAIFREDLSEKLEQYRALLRGLSLGELRPYLQVQVDAQGAVTGAEMLLRWHRTGHGVRSPAEFIPLAEETGLIREVGLMVLEQAGHYLQQWSQQPHTARWMLSVNVSPHQLAAPGFVEDVRAVLERTGARADRLRLEITESALADDLPRVVAIMAALRGDGVSWSLDDFGTGYSSLSLLQGLPLDELKIDQSFVRSMDGHGQRRLVGKIIEMAQVLGIATVAEGVETDEQCAWLRGLGCSSYQGFLFGRPIPAETFVQRYSGGAATASA